MTGRQDRPTNRLLDDRLTNDDRTEPDRKAISTGTPAGRLADHVHTNFRQRPGINISNTAAPVGRQQTDQPTDRRTERAGVEIVAKRRPLNYPTPTSLLCIASTTMKWGRGEGAGGGDREDGVWAGRLWGGVPDE